jgi:hypothetical protein
MILLSRLKTNLRRQSKQLFLDSGPYGIFPI